MKKKFHIKAKIFCLLAAALFMAAPGPMKAAPSDPAHVAVFPFQVHSNEDISYLVNGIVDMLSSRFFNEEKVLVVSREKVDKALAGALLSRMTQEEVVRIGKDLGADYVIYGSVTHLEKASSIDARAVDVSGEKSPVLFYKQCDTLGEVIEGVNRLAMDVREKMFGVPSPLAAAPPEPGSGPAVEPVEKAPAPEKDTYDHPEEKYAAKTRKLEENSLSRETGLTPVAVSLPQKEIAEFLKSKNFKDEFKGMAAGDVDGDGNVETVMISGRKIYIYRIKGETFSKVKEIDGPRHQKYISVDVADIKKDGRAEIFITRVRTDSKSIESFVLEWNGKDFENIHREKNRYYRIIRHPERGEILVVQKAGIGEVFLPGIFEAAWDGAAYSLLDRINAPKSAFLYGLSLGDIAGDGRVRAIVMGKDDYIRVFDDSGAREWKSEDHYGGSESHLDDSGKTESANRVYLPQRILLTDMDRNGSQEVITVKNDSKAGRVFTKYRFYNRGQFESLSWDGLGLSPIWSTKKLSGYICDFAVGDLDNDGKMEVVAAVVMKRSRLFKKGSSAVVVYDLH